MCEHHDSASSGHDVVEQAVECMVGVAVNINEMKRKHENIVRVMELQTRLVPRCVANELTALGQLVLEVSKELAAAVTSITACTVVQAVVKATSQSNGKGQILTPWGSETLERISMKLGIYNRVADMPTHANPSGAATTWVVWANM